MLRRLMNHFAPYLPSLNPDRDYFVSDRPQSVWCLSGCESNPSPRSWRDKIGFMFYNLWTLQPGSGPLLPCQWGNWVLWFICVRRPWTKTDVRYSIWSHNSRAQFSVDRQFSYFQPILHFQPKAKSSCFLRDSDEIFFWFWNPHLS